VVKRLFGAFLLVISMLLPSAVFAADDNKINLRLFGKSVVGSYQGCSFALWQRNRDPGKDKFAYVFFVRFHDAQPMPALVKIGKKVLELEKVEIGIKDSGLSDKFQLYRDAEKTTSLLIEIQEEKRVGDNTVVAKARLTFIQRNKFPFVMRVKGGFRCPEANSKAANDDASAGAERGEQPVPGQPVSGHPVPDKPGRAVLPTNLDPNGVRLGTKVEFNSLSKVPRHVLQVVRDNGNACNLDNVAGHGARYAISDAMTLWLVPCDIFAANSSGMLITALNGTKHAVGLSLPKRPGQGGGEPGYDMLWPVIHPKSGVVTVTSMGRRGDCGTVEHYQLIVAEGESVELKLLEVREKNDCNGVKVAPENLPLVYRAR